MLTNNIPPPGSDNQIRVFYTDFDQVSDLHKKIIYLWPGL